jgi:ectoine hydroxylase-related dioxygenase (phytanoyl-CoA dioxygenase family)
MKLSDDYVLSSQQCSNYEKNGHIFLPDVVSAHVIGEYRNEIQATVKSYARNYLPLDKRDTYGKAFIQVCNLWTQNEKVKQFVLARRFAHIAAQLMGVQGVRIYHDQALFKEPGGGHTPWHQDQIYWPIHSSNVLTMWMPLVDIPDEVGSMTFASGSHTYGYINKMVISDESHRTLASFIEGKNIPTVNYGGMRAGDATFHAGWTLHSAPGNPTDQMREVMTVIYVADGTGVAEPDSQARKNDLEAWIPGRKPGELIDSPLNPLVYATK